MTHRAHRPARRLKPGNDRGQRVAMRGRSSPLSSIWVSPLGGLQPGPHPCFQAWRPVYGTVIRLARLSWHTGSRRSPSRVWITDQRRRRRRDQPPSYLGFTFGFARLQQGLGRKGAVHGQAGGVRSQDLVPIMREACATSVDRQDGSASYDAAVRMLKAAGARRR